MSLKAELETWSAALKAYDEEDFEKALDLFSRIADSSKILTNMGLIYATLGEHEAAVERFIEATGLDSYLAVAYFQCGVSNFLLARYELAFKDFEEAQLYLRGNQFINYEQLGLQFRLFSAEVLFNKGLSQIYVGRLQEGLADMEEARKDKATDEHNVIDDAIADRGEGYTVFSIPVGVLYRPSEKKSKNLTAKDYLGKAILVAASDQGDAYTEFSGVTRLKQGISPSGAPIERPDTDLGPGPGLGRSASSNLPKPGIDVVPKGSLARSKTTLNVPTNTRELTSGTNVSSPARATALSPVTRSNTTSSGNRSISSPGSAGLARGPSTKPAGAAGRAPLAPPKDSRLTEFYDNYMDSYGGDELPPLPTSGKRGDGGGAPDRVAAWARSNANPPMRSGSKNGPGSNYAGSSYGGGGGTIKRKLTRRMTTTRTAPSQYEEEEGYVSGEYDDGPFELVKIRVKIHYQDDVRGMALTPETSFDEFMDRVTAKFNKNLNGLGLKFKDEDGGKVSLRDESDYELAIETARESSKGKPEGKLELWLQDV